jgi:hypothetical protein
MYTASLNVSFAAASDTKYWFSVFDEGPESQWGWLTARDDYGMTHAYTFVPPGDSWAINNQFSSAYRLTTYIPEPSSLVLFGMASSIGGLLCCIRHLTKAARVPFAGTGRA